MKNYFAIFIFTTVITSYSYTSLIDIKDTTSGFISQSIANAQSGIGRLSHLPNTPGAAAGMEAMALGMAYLERFQEEYKQPVAPTVPAKPVPTLAERQAALEQNRQAMLAVRVKRQEELASAAQAQALAREQQRQALLAKLAEARALRGKK